MVSPKKKPAAVRQSAKRKMSLKSKAPKTKTARAARSVSVKVKPAPQARIDRPLPAHVDLTTRVGTLVFKNPVLLASGCGGYGPELAEFYDPSVLGGIVVKSLSLKPRLGNSTPRTIETASGMLNAIGIQSNGIQDFIDNKLPALQTAKTVVIASVFEETVDGYAELARILDHVDRINGIEVNLSCPNVEKGGIVFGTQPDQAARVIEYVRRATTKPVWAKLSPNVTDIVAIAKACEGAGADAVTAINTLQGMAVDWRRQKPILANRTGGLSGPAIKPVALRMVDDLKRSDLQIPIVGAGGISCADDICEFLVAGAQAVQLGTINYLDPLAGPRLVNDLAHLLDREKIQSVQSLIGTMSGRTMKQMSQELADFFKSF